MEYLIILTTLISASLCQPIVKTWTLDELSLALEKHTDVAMQPYLEDALNQIMYSLFTGNEQDVMAIIPSPTGDKTWTMEQLKKAIHDPDIKPAYQTYIGRALHILLEMNHEGKHQDSIEVTLPALDISVWSISDVKNALEDPNTKPKLMKYLKKAEIQIQKAIEEGQNKDEVRAVLVTPVGVVPGDNGIIPAIISRNTIDA